MTIPVDTCAHGVEVCGAFRAFTSPSMDDFNGVGGFDAQDAGADAHDVAVLAVKVLKEDGMAVA